MPKHAVIAILPILPSLIGLLSLIPAILAGGLTVWRFKTQTNDPRQSASVWRRFWLRQIPSLLALISLGLLVRYGWARWYRERTIPAEVVAAPSNDQWLMARAGLDRTGRADSVPLPQSPNVHLHWKFRPPGTSFYGDPLPHGENLYVVGSREGVGTIYALSQSDGHVVWSCRPEGYRETVSSPVVYNNMLFVGEGLHYDRNTRLIAIALAGPLTGKVLWTYPVQGHLECTPTVVNGQVYLAAGDDGIYCLQLKLATEPPDLRWHVRGEHAPDVDVSVAVHQHRVYVGTGTGGNALLVLNALTGKELDRWPMPSPVRGLPSIGGTRIAYSSGEGDFKSLGTAPGQLTIRCLDVSVPCSVHADCQPRIDIPLPTIVLGAMAIANDSLYCGCADGRVRRYDFRGTLLSEWDSGAPIAGSILTDGPTIVVHNRDGWVFGLDSTSLRPRWSHRMGSPGHYVSSPVAVNGRVFIGTDNEGVLCLDSSAE